MTISPDQFELITLIVLMHAVCFILEMMRSFTQNMDLHTQTSHLFVIKDSNALDVRFNFQPILSDWILENGPLVFPKIFKRDEQ
jgi:hypothetical protein